MVYHQEKLISFEDKVRLLNAIITASVLISITLIVMVLLTGGTYYRCMTYQCIQLYGQLLSLTCDVPILSLYPSLQTELTSMSIREK